MRHAPPNAGSWDTVRRLSRPAGVLVSLASAVTASQLAPAASAPVLIGIGTATAIALARRPRSPRGPADDTPVAYSPPTAEPRSARPQTAVPWAIARLSSCPSTLDDESDRALRILRQHGCDEQREAVLLAWLETPPIDRPWREHVATVFDLAQRMGLGGIGSGARGRAFRRFAPLLARSTNPLRG